MLVMRLWPRGIRKDRIDLWLRELGPVLPLLRAFRAGAVPWPEYTRRYLQGLERPEARADLDRILSLARQGPVTILCGCADEAHCHRSLLAGYIMGGPEMAPHTPQRSDTARGTRAAPRVPARPRLRAPGGLGRGLGGFDSPPNPLNDSGDRGPSRVSRDGAERGGFGGLR
ncbi:MAG: DUF488 family protein [Candidatus Rokubacteria bacterium]|nr:DUF488 family protein [Candidatus Rokubacteria bacterium]